MQKLIT